MNRENYSETHYALQVAFQTMKERCLQLQTRLATVEEENLCLRTQSQKRDPEDLVKIYPLDEKSLINNLQEKMDELINEKSQLAHHIFMVASENRQLWNRLTRLSRAKKSMGNPKNTNTLKCQDVDSSNALTYSFKDISNLNTDNDKCITKGGSNELSLEEISLQLINSIMQEKSELEQQNDMTTWPAGHELNLINVGFTYPDDISIDSFEQLKYHDSRLNQVKEALLIQQSKLQDTLMNFKKLKNENLCTRCNENLKDSEQINLDSIRQIENKNICPLCGNCVQGDTPEYLSEHVLSHFKSTNS